MAGIIYDASKPGSDEMKIRYCRSEIANIIREREEEKPEIADELPVENFEEVAVTYSEPVLDKVEKLSFKVLRLIGTSLVGFSFIYLFFIYQPVIKDLVSQYLSKKAGTLQVLGADPTTVPTGQVSPTIYSGQAQPTDVPKQIDKQAVEEAVALGLDPYFSIYIPKLDAKAGIIPNVGISNSADYLEILKKGVAHAAGSNLPGEGKNIYLFSHSTNNSPLNITRYNAVFNDLKNLESGDQVIIYYQENKFVYEVKDKMIVEPDDISFLNKDFGGERLILQTCYPPGTTEKRLLVITKPI